MSDIIDLIDESLRDFSVSADAMRINPGEVAGPDIRPSLDPRWKVRRWGAFRWAAYVVTSDVMDGDRRVPMWLYMGVRRTRRGARRLAEAELASRRRR